MTIDIRAAGLDDAAAIAAIYAHHVLHGTATYDAIPPSIALHAALGFQHAGRLSAMGWKTDRWLDSVYMQIALGDGLQRTRRRVERYGQAHHVDI